VTIREPICGRSVCLAPLSTASVGEWVRWMDDPETTRYLYAPGEQPHEPHTAASLLDWGRRILADTERVVFALEEQGGGRLIGDARLTPVRGGRAKFSIMIGVSEFRGRGLGSEATRLVCRFAFEELNMREIVLEVDPRNLAAVQAYLAAGFERGPGNDMRLTRPGWQAVVAGPAAE
jgi:RimJ/RimL family protein N-acetyltransferase